MKFFVLINNSFVVTQPLDLILNDNTKFIYEVTDTNKYKYPKLSIIKDQIPHNNSRMKYLHLIFAQMHEILWQFFDINLSPYTLFHSQIIELSNSKISVFHNRQITSYGGGGTSCFCYFANNYNNHEIQFPVERSHLPWKHLPKPPTTQNFYLPPTFKALYIINNPIDTILSIFRREFQNLHPHNIMINPFKYINKVKLFPKEYALDYRKYNKILWNYKDYINHKIDLWEIKKHCYSWTTKRKSNEYPIMVIKYDAIWNNLDHIFTFLELPVTDIDKFPLKTDRNSSYKHLDKEYMTKFNFVYGDLIEYTNSLPDIFIN